MEAKVRSRRSTFRKHYLDLVNDPTLAKKRRTGPRCWPTKFQGKWESTLGTLFIVGNEGYYGDNLLLPNQATKFLKNITASEDGKNIRGKWKWECDEKTFGRFDLELSENFSTFDGTWGWGRKRSGGGFWNGHLTTGKYFNLNIKPDATEALTAPFVVTPTGTTIGNKNPSFGHLQRQKRQIIDPAMLIYQRQMNAYTMASFPQVQLTADKSQKNGTASKSDPVKQTGRKKFVKTAIESIQVDIPSKEVRSTSKPVEGGESLKKELTAEADKNKEAAAAAAVPSAGVVMSPLVFIYTQ